MDRTQPQIGDRQGRPAKVGECRHAGKAGDPQGTDAVDDRWSGYVYPAFHHTDDRAACSRQRDRDRAGMRPFALLGTTRVLQPYRARVYWSSFEIDSGEVIDPLGRASGITHGKNVFHRSYINRY